MNNAIGIDLGSAGPKLVVLRKDGSLALCQAMDAAQEGVLDRQELLDTLREWLDKHQLTGQLATISLPQFQATTLVKNYPVVNDANLAAMVELETRQAAGLSDEAMQHGFCRLTSAAGKTTPVLVGIARAKDCRERVESLANTGIRVSSLTMSALAVVNAFLHLHPEKSSCPSPILLLDLGQENSTAILLINGSPRYIAPLLFSGERLEASNQTPPAKDGGIILLRSPQPWRELNLLEEPDNSPIYPVLLQLRSDILAVLEQWQSTESGANALQEIHLCGGIAHLKGLDTWLARRMEVDVSAFGPSWQGHIRPECAQALGLALEQAGLARFTLSLLPPEVKNLRARERNWPLLAAALLCFCLVLTSLELIWLYRTHRATATLQELRARLQTCAELVPKIESTQKSILENEAKLIPIADPAAQIPNILHIIELLNTSRGENDWFIYLADAASAQPATSPPATPYNTPSPSLFGTTENASASYLGLFPVVLPYTKVPLTTCYIALGYSTLSPEDPYAPMKTLADKLKTDGFLQGVDLLSDEQMLNMSAIFRPWQQFLRNFPKQKQWALRLPLATPSIDSGLMPRQPSRRP